MLGKILIIDFDDSFTYNIANMLFFQECSLEVVGHDIFFSKIFNKLMKSEDKHAVILGPGPGHPQDYEHYFQQIKELKKNPNLYLMGICLGHQMLGLIEGYKIGKAKSQVHGQSIEIEFKRQLCCVQRYNSLAVYDGDQELDTLFFEQGISYQFHPESVGTSNGQLFFQDLLNFINK